LFNLGQNELFKSIIWGVEDDQQGRCC
jgi:hypothetical protein